MNRSHQGLLVLGLGCVLLMPVPAATAGEDQVGPLRDLTVEKLRLVNQANRDALGTAVVQETVSELYRERPGQDQEAADRVTRAYLQMREDLINLAIGAGADERTLERIHETYEARLNSVDGAVVVWRLNRNTRVARTRAVDFGLGQARYDDDDLRDLEALAAKHGLSEDDRRYNLSKTLSEILKPDGSVLLVPAGELAALRTLPRFNQDEEALHFGIVPSWVFDAAEQLKLRTVRADNQTCVELTGPVAGQCASKVVVELRPEYEYRLTRLTTYDENGEVAKDFRASGYRPVDGLLVPFETKLRRAGHGFADYFVRQRTVKSVRVNQGIEPGRFKIPAGYHVQDIRVGPPSVPRLPQEP